MSVNGAVGQPDVKADDIPDFADILIAFDMRRRESQCFFMGRHPPFAPPNQFVSITYHRDLLMAIDGR